MDGKHDSTVFSEQDETTSMESGRQSLVTLKHYLIASVILWSLLIIGSLSWNIHQLDQQAMALVRKEAIANFNKDQGFRLWGTRHGGVYVPITEKTRPSPYMEHVPDRDVETTTGLKLTLMNPAFMVRELMDDYRDLYGIRGKITGFSILNPINEPDAWEVMALNKMREGAPEVSEVTTLDGEPFLRFMRPMFMKPGCEKCHALQGLKEGDLAGGVDVAVPLAPYLKSRNKTTGALALSHAVIWLIGIAAIAFGSRQLKARIKADNMASVALIRAEAEVRAMNQELEQRVQERTRKLEEEIHTRKRAETAMRDARIQAEEANKAKSEFLARMSHELRTPLNAIIGLTEMLEEEAVDDGREEELEPLHRVHRAGMHLLSVINDILDLSRIEAGKMPLIIKDTPVLGMAEDIAKTAQPLAESNGNLIKLVSKKDDLGTIKTDQTRLRQVLLNLMSNACKFTENGTITLSVDHHVHGDTQETVVYTVQDTGIGIKDELVEKLFHDFSQIDPDIAHKYGGSGLGLSISRRIIRALNGTLTVNSVFGEGSTFSIELPVEGPPSGADDA